MDPADPGISPLSADLRGLPPLLVQVGGAETIRDVGVRLVERACQAGVAAGIEIWPEHVHIWQSFAVHFRDSRRALARIGAFVQEQVAVEAPAEPVTEVTPAALDSAPAG